MYHMYLSTYIYLQLLLESVSVNASETVNIVVNIDPSIGRDTEFVFTYSGSSFTLDVLVTSPSGVNYTTDGTHSHTNNVTKHVTISFNETEVRCVIRQYPTNTYSM